MEHIKLGISPGSRRFWISKHKGEDSIEINVETIQCHYVVCIQMDQNGVHWWLLVIAVTNLGAFRKQVIFLSVQ
jgi:hypothetical protein